MGLLITIIASIIVSFGLAWFAYWAFESEPLAFKVVLLVGLIFATGMAIDNWTVSYRNEHWATCHVIDKDRGDSKNGYRVYTSNCDTLENRDMMLRGKWNSANLWTQIEPGKDYRFLIVGSRVPLFSRFANILAVEPVS